MGYKRKRAGRGDGRRFTRTAMRVHRRNGAPVPRGGIRL